MDITTVSGMASLATSMAQTQTQQQAGIAVLKKAMDIESSNAMALIQAIPPAPSGNVGQNINTTA